jgi:hypothetical protein
MGQAIPRQHPAVVLRSHYRQLKTLLAILLVAIVGLGVTVAILATDDEGSAGTTSAQPINSIEYGGFNPATGRPMSGQAVETVRPSAQNVRPDESAVAAAIATQPEVARPDESKVAAAISRTQAQSADGQHDESDVAAAISGR